MRRDHGDFRSFVERAVVAARGSLEKARFLRDTRGRRHGAVIDGRIYSHGSSERHSGQCEHGIHRRVLSSVPPQAAPNPPSPALAGLRLSPETPSHLPRSTYSARPCVCKVTMPSNYTATDVAGDRPGPPTEELCTLLSVDSAFTAQRACSTPSPTHLLTRRARRFYRLRRELQASLRLALKKLEKVSLSGRRGFAWRSFQTAREEALRLLIRAHLIRVHTGVVQIPARWGDLCTLAQEFCSLRLAPYGPWGHIVEAAQKGAANGRVPVGILVQLARDRNVLLADSSERLLQDACQGEGRIERGEGGARE